MPGSVDRDIQTPPTPVQRTKFEAPPSPEVAEGAISSTLGENPASEASHSEDYPGGLCPFGDETPGDSSKEPIYATIDPSTKSPEKIPNNDNLVGDQNLTPMRRSDSEETIYSTPLRGSDKAIENLNKRFDEVSSNSSGTPSTFSPSGSYYADSKAGSDTPLITPSKRTNRFWPRAKYAMQQKGFIIPTVSATFITLYLAAYASLEVLQNKKMFIAFITNNPKFLTVPGIIALSLFAIGIAFAIKQFRNTVEHQIEEKNPDKILDAVLQHQPKDKVIKSIKLGYGNNTDSNFTLSVLESENGFINIDKKVISRSNRIESVINDRPLFTALMTGIIVANVALPLLLYAEGGISKVTTFYQGLLTNIGLSPLLTASNVFAVSNVLVALSILCLGVHYYNKTNCINLVYPQEKINPEKVNGEIVNQTKDIQTDVLEGSHEKEAKRVCVSLSLERIVTSSHNGQDVVYSVG